MYGNLHTPVSSTTESYYYFSSMTLSRWADPNVAISPDWDEPKLVIMIISNLENENNRNLGWDVYCEKLGVLIVEYKSNHFKFMVDTYNDMWTLQAMHWVDWCFLCPIWKGNLHQLEEFRTIPTSIVALWRTQLIWWLNKGCIEAFPTTITELGTATNYLCSQNRSKES